MTQTWTGPRGAKALDRTAKVGDVLWVVIDVEKRVAPYEDAQLASKFPVTHWSRLYGKPMVAGNVSAGDLVLKYGMVWSEQPKGLRDVAGPGPQVSAPLGADTERYLDEPELKGMEKLSAEARDRRRKGKSSKQGWF
ncbi:hypothetical protein ACIP69_18365 [Streptomyces hygroscopicus]|uniref:hypothetical protein n=1 Tax=Streptomyces hygroscopicus TaxID=1912 RepID=UPI0037F4D079